MDEETENKQTSFWSPPDVTRWFSSKCFTPCLPVFRNYVVQLSMCNYKWIYELKSNVILYQGRCNVRFHRKTKLLPKKICTQSLTFRSVPTGFFSKEIITKYYCRLLILTSMASLVAITKYVKCLNFARAVCRFSPGTWKVKIRYSWKRAPHGRCTSAIAIKRLSGQIHRTLCMPRNFDKFGNEIIVLDTPDCRWAIKPMTTDSRRLHAHNVRDMRFGMFRGKLGWVLNVYFVSNCDPINSDVVRILLRMIKQYFRRSGFHFTRKVKVTDVYQFRASKTQLAV